MIEGYSKMVTSLSSANECMRATRSHVSQYNKLVDDLEWSTRPPWCHAPSWLDLGEPSHTRIHLTMDHDSTQLNASPRMGNVEYSLTWTSPTSTDISGQAGTAR